MGGALGFTENSGFVDLGWALGFSLGFIFVTVSGVLDIYPDSVFVALVGDLGFSKGSVIFYCWFFFSAVSIVYDGLTVFSFYSTIFDEVFYLGATSYGSDLMTDSGSDTEAGAEGLTFFVSFNYFCSYTNSLLVTSG